MDLVLQEELARWGGGWLAASQSIGIGLPPIIQWGSEEMKERGIYIYIYIYIYNTYMYNGFINLVL